MRTVQQVVDNISKIPPDGCDLKVGDLVTLTNEYGLKFPNFMVIGFDLESEQNEWQKKNGRFVYTVAANEGGAYWFPERPEDLKKQSGWIDDPIRGTEDQRRRWQNRHGLIFR